MNTIDFGMNLSAFGNDVNQLGFGADVRSQCIGRLSIEEQVRVSRPVAKSSICDPIRSHVPQAIREKIWAGSYID